MHVHKDKNSKRLLSAGASVDILAYCVFVENRIFVFKKAFFFVPEPSAEVQCEWSRSNCAASHQVIYLGLGRCMCSSGRRKSYGLLAKAAVFSMPLTKCHLAKLGTWHAFLLQLSCSFVDYEIFVI